MGDLKEKVLYVEEELEKMKNPAEYTEGALEIQRVQSWTKDGWETMSYILLLAYGGPSIRLIVPDGLIIASWGTDRIEYSVNDVAKAKCGEIANYLDEVFGEF